MKQITPTIKKFAENFYNKFSSGMNKALGTTASSKVVWTAVKAIVVANLADTAVKDTPILYNLLKGVSNLQALNIKLQDLTIGKIPGVGNAFTYLRDKLMDFQEFTFGAITPTFTEIQQGARQTAKKWNDPKVYEHYPKFMSSMTMSSGYPNTKYSSCHGESGWNPEIGQVPSIMTYQMVLGFPHNRDVAENRYNTMYALTKAARGLSSTSYTYKDVQDYFIALTAILLIHTTLNKVISLVVAADPTKPRMPRVALDAMDFSLEEVTNNLAEYMEFHKYMIGIMNTSGFVSWGHLIDKLKYSEKFLKDSNQKIATYYNMNYVLAHNYVLKEEHIEEITFHLSSLGNNDSRQMLDLKSMRNIFNMWLAFFTRNRAISDFKSDILGCLGTENALNLKTNYENKFSSAMYDELGLSAVKNADMDAAGDIYLLNAGEAKTKRVAYYCDLESDIFGAVRVQAIRPASNPTAIWLPCTLAVPFAQSMNTVAMPAKINTARTAVACYKDTLQNGEVSEILSKRIRGFSIIPRTVNDTNYVSREFYPICDLIIGSVFDQGNDDGTYGDSNVGWLNPKNFEVSGDEDKAMAAMYWSLLDWSPALVQPFVIGNTGNRHFLTLWDMDNIGSVSDFTLAQSSTLIDYSMLDPNIKVTGERAKQIQNLIDLYSK